MILTTSSILLRVSRLQAVEDSLGEQTINNTKDD
jgi:hypothetical protein